jgi:HSP20 family protein
MPKKSFLEILTGGELRDDPVAVQQPALASASTPQLNYLMEDRNYQYAPASYQPEPVPVEKPEPAEEDKNWFSDESEGQLTVDVYQTPNDIVIKSAIAGIKAEDVEVSITNDMVTIRGKREKEEHVKGEDYYYQELYWGSFSRSIILPTDVETEKASASLKDGILTIRLPKVEKVRTRKIKVASLS